MMLKVRYLTRHGGKHVFFLLHLPRTSKVGLHCMRNGVLSEFKLRLWILMWL